MKKSLLIILSLASICLFANENKYASSVKNLYETADAKKVKGRLLPTSQIKILSKNGENIRIQFEGYMKQGVPNAVYYSIGPRILVAGLSKKANFEYETISTSKDEDGLKWKKVAMTAYTKNSDVSDDLNALYETAQTKFNANCALCHPGHPSTEFTANQWPSIMRSMVNRTPLTKDENYLITQYLQKHAKDMQK